MKLSRRPTIYDIEAKVDRPGVKRLRVGKIDLDLLFAFAFFIFIICPVLYAFLFAFFLIAVGLLDFIFKENIISVFVILTLAILFLSLSFSRALGESNNLIIATRLGINRTIQRDLAIGKLYLRSLKIFYKGNVANILLSLNSEYSLVDSRIGFLKFLNLICGIMFFANLYIPTALLIEEKYRLPSSSLTDIVNLSLPVSFNSLIEIMNNNSVLINLLFTSLAYAFSNSLSQIYSRRKNTLLSIKSILENITI